MRKSALGRLLLFQLLALCLLDPAESAAPKTIDDGFVIKDVTVVSPERKDPLPHAMVAVRNGRIAAIGTDLIAGPHTSQIDGRGRFLIPGLIDSHVHLGNMGPLDDDTIDAHPELLKA